MITISGDPEDQLPVIIAAQLADLDARTGAERWKRSSILNVDPAEVDDWVSRALQTLGDMRQLSKEKVPPARVWDYFRKWHSVSLRILASVERFGSKGRKIKQSDAFRFAINKALEEIADAGRAG